MGFPKQTIDISKIAKEMGNPLSSGSLLLTGASLSKTLEMVLHFIQLLH